MPDVFKVQNQVEADDNDSLLAMFERRYGAKSTKGMLPTTKAGQINRLTQPNAKIPQVSPTSIFAASNKLIDKVRIKTDNERQRAAIDDVFAKNGLMDYELLDPQNIDFGKLSNSINNTLSDPNFNAVVRETARFDNLSKSADKVVDPLLYDEWLGDIDKYKNGEISSYDLNPSDYTASDYEEVMGAFTSGIKQDKEIRRAVKGDLQTTDIYNSYDPIKVKTNAMAILPTSKRIMNHYKKVAKINGSSTDIDTLTNIMLNDIDEYVYKTASFVKNEVPVITPEHKLEAEAKKANIAEEQRKFKNRQSSERLAISKEKAKSDGGSIKKSSSTSGSKIVKPNTTGSKPFTKKPNI